MSSQISNGVQIKVAGQVLERRDPSKYKPVVPESYVEDVALRLYGMKVVDWNEMNSFYDRHYHIFVDSTINNKFIKAKHPLGYVLKILNSLDSKSPGIIDSQHKVFEHMIGKGIPVPEVVQNVNGATWSFEMIPSDRNPSQLKGPYIIQIVNNMIFHKPYLPATLFNIGVFAGRIHNGLEDFENKFVGFRTFIWSLEEMSALTDYCSAVQDKQNLDLVQKVIQAFKDEVTPKYNQLNEDFMLGFQDGGTSIIISIESDKKDRSFYSRDPLNRVSADKKTDDKQCCDVTAFIDWGHMTYSYRIFDVAIIIAYLSIQSKEINQLDVGGHILAG